MRNTLLSEEEATAVTTPVDRGWLADEIKLALRRAGTSWEFEDVFGSNLLTGKEFWTVKDKDYVGRVRGSVMYTMWEKFL